MKKIMIGIAFAFLLSVLSAAQVMAAPTWTGEWSTTWAKMILTQTEDNVVTGTYAFNGGRIEGRAEGNKLIGNWYQTNGSGEFVFEMNAAGTEFNGKWRRAGDTAPMTSAWRGKRL